MPQANWIIVLHLILLWGSVATGLVAGWRLPLSNLILVPLGIILWGAGLLYNMHNVKALRQRPALHRSALVRRSYRRILARTMMNLGIGLVFASWLTLIVSLVLIPIYSAAANKRRQYLEYMRSGMQSDVFPDRISRH